MDYTYDESFTPNYKGRLTTVSDASGTTKFYYDMLGRTWKTVKTVDGIPYTTETNYDALSRTTSLKYPDLETVNYNYNTGGGLWQVGGYAIYTGYKAAGQVGTITYNNGAVSTYTYDPATLRLDTMQTTGGGGGSGYTVAPTAYNWVTANTPTGITGDDQAGALSLPFNFNFYGTNYSQAYVSSNGFVSFGSGSADYTPDSVPNTTLPNALAAGLWRDLYPPAGDCTNNACITYGSTASQFAVSYNNVKNYVNTSRQTFQIVLNSDGSIVYQYVGVTNDVTTGIGVENQTGTVGTAYGAPSNGLAIKFTPSSGGTLLQNLQYDYDNVGNILTITDNLDGSRTQGFTYDELNRLRDAQSTAYGGTISYQYNQIGNMISNSRVGTYNYPTNGIRPHAVSQAGPLSYAYDANGNMTSKNGTAIAYDYDNRPTSIGASTFVYDYAGQRVKKNGTVYIGNIYECTGSVCTKYIFAGGTRIAMKSGSTVNYYHTDHLGSSSIVTNASGTKVEELYYYPYGATRVNTGSVNVKHKYTGQEEDAETGLYYYGARYYDPTIGRFISADTIVQAPGYPQTLNRYSYAGNNPIIYTDPSGHFIEGFIVGAIIGGFIAGVQSDWNFQAVLTGAIIGGISGGVFAEASAFTQGALGGVVQSGTSGGMISGMVGGGAAGATAGGLNAAYYGGNIGDAMLRGAGLGAAGGAAFGAIGVPNSFGKAGAYALAGGGLSELGGGDFWQGVALSGGAALAMMGWEYMRDWTDASSLKGSARVHKYNEYGELLTTGKRQCVGCTPDNTNSFTGSGGYEGSDGLVYNNRAINVISKTHDFGMGWSYQGTGNFVAGGQFYNSAVQAYSYAAMPIAAAYTGFAFSADPFAQTLIYGLSVK